MIPKTKAAGLMAIVAFVVAAFTFLLTCLFVDVRNIRNEDSVLVSKQQQALMHNYTKLYELAAVLSEHYLYETDEQDLVVGAMKGMAAILDDPYTEYMTAEEYGQYEDDRDSVRFGVGIGIVYDEELQTVVTETVYENSPALEAGILPGDVLLAVGEDGGESVSVIGMTTEQIADLVRGDENTVVHLLMRRGEQQVAFAVTRRHYQADQAYGSMIGGVAYIRIRSFNGNAVGCFIELMDELMPQNPKGLILDLRQNGGGSLGVLTEIAQQILPKDGVLLETKNIRGEVLSTEKLTKGTKLDIPIVCLIDGYTASASEVLACAVQDIVGGKTVGTQSFGKNVGQSFYQFADGSMLKYTSFGWFSQNGRSLLEEGIRPDYLVELPEEHRDYNIEGIPQDEDTQLQRALEVIAGMAGG